MIQGDNSPIPASASRGRPGGSFARHVLSALFPARWTGKTDKGTATDAEMARVIEDLRAGLCQGQSIKAGPIDVCRTTWRGREVVIKWYKHVGWLHSLRHALKGSRARRAWTNAHRLLELGIPTPRPLGFFDERHGPLLWQSCLVTEYVRGPNLHRVLHDVTVPEGRKRRLVRQTLRLIERLGAHGISHGDMKHTNVLCPGSRIVLTDLDGMTIHKLRRLSRRCGGGDTARFLRWRTAGQEAESPEPEGAGVVQTPGSGFLELASSAGTVWVNRDFRSQELEEALTAGPQALTERFRPQPILSAPTSRVCRFTATFHGEQIGVYLKEYLERSVGDRLKHLVRPSRAMRTLRAAQMLRRHGFHVPEVLAVGTLSRGSGARSFMVTREAPAAVPIYKYFLPDPPAPCSLREKRQLLREFGQAVGRLHRDGIAHGDLRLGNVLARKAIPSSQSPAPRSPSTANCQSGWEFLLIDNERTRKWAWLPRCLRLKNLVQVNMLPQGISRTDRMRFFQAYVLANPSVCAAYKQWAERIMTRTHQRFRRKGWL